MKIVINTCFGGFGLSKKAIERLAELGHQEAIEVLPDFKGNWSDPCMSDIERNHPLLVRVVEELGEEANGQYARLEVEDVDGDGWYVHEYDGNERIKFHDPEVRGVRLY
jgi:hypothetical protein